MTFLYINNLLSEHAESSYRIGWLVPLLFNPVSAENFEFSTILQLCITILYLLLYLFLYGVYVFVLCFPYLKDN